MVYTRMLKLPFRSSQTNTYLRHFGLFRASAPHLGHFMEVMRNVLRARMEFIMAPENMNDGMTLTVVGLQMYWNERKVSGYTIDRAIS